MYPQGSYSIGNMDPGSISHGFGIFLASDRFNNATTMLTRLQEEIKQKIQLHTFFLYVIHPL